MTFSDINNPTFEEVEAFITNNASIKYFSYPIFRKYLEEKKQRCAVETNEMKRSNNIVEVFVFARNIIVLSSVWPDIPADYFTTYFSMLKKGIPLQKLDKNSRHTGLANPKVAEWFRQHCTGQRFLFMLFQHCKKMGKQATTDHKEPSFLAQKYGEEPDYKLAQTTTDPEVLHNLCLNGHHGIWYHVAKNVNTSSETLDLMFSSSEIFENIGPFIMDVVAANPNASDTVKSICYLERGWESTETTLVDTLKQLEDMRNKNYEVPRTVTGEDGKVSTIKRWRLQEVHDHISFLYLCQSVENTPFDQVTLRVPYTEAEWKVFSPIDSLGLAMWAHRARNCVRSREDKIHSGSSEIVCIERNGDAYCTIEINGPKSRKTEGLRIEEIQQKGLSSGMTRDDNNMYFSLVQRALNSVSKS